eukprot:Trichotokara_eunicae@DN923_c0_g1_i1.p1
MLKDGWLDFAVVDGNSSDPVYMLHKKETIEPNNCMVVISNYVLDSLLTDAFQIHEGQIYESLVSIYSAQEEPDPTDSDIIARMSVKWGWKPLDLPELSAKYVGLEVEENNFYRKNLEKIDENSMDKKKKKKK